MTFESLTTFQQKYFGIHVIIGTGTRLSTYFLFGILDA